MSKQYLMALDGGTGSFRAILFDTAGNQLYVEQREWTHISDPDIPGSMGFDYDNNWQLIKSCIADIIRKNQIDSQDIVGIATTTMREGFVLYDNEGKELIGFANVDGRSIAESAFLKQEYPELEKALYQTTGESFALGALPRLLWIKNHQPDLMAKATHINMLNDWISYKLSGKLAVEPSNACTTGLFNIQTKVWEFDKLAELGIHLSQTPVINSGDYLGNVTEATAKETGLSTSTKVIMGGGDAQLGCIGVGSIAPGQTTLLGGSFWQLEYNVNDVVMDSDYEARINCHAIPDLYQYELIAWMPGVSANWYVESFFDYDIEQLGGKGPVYKQIEAKTSTIPAGSYGIITTFSDKMNMLNLNNCAPTFTNFNFDTTKFNRYSFFKSIMEATAYVTKLHKDKIEDLTNNKITSLIFAGGASSNANWCQIIADVLNVEVKVPVNKEATAFGAALLAGIGTGIYQSLTEAVSLVNYETVYTPSIENHNQYLKFIETWQSVYQAQLALSNQNITSSMWKAPGL